MKKIDSFDPFLSNFAFADCKFSKNSLSSGINYYYECRVLTKYSIEIVKVDNIKRKTEDFPTGSVIFDTPSSFSKGYYSYSYESKNIKTALS